MTPFRVEVSGTWRSMAMQTDEPWTQVFIVAAPGPSAAKVAGVQLFGEEAGRRRCVVPAVPSARVIVDPA